MADSSPIDFSKYANDQYSNAVKSGSFNNLLRSDYDRIKADSNHDGVVSKKEYDSYILSTHSSKPSIPEQNIKENHYFYHFDISVLLVVTLACVTTIIVKWMQYKLNK